MAYGAALRYSEARRITCLGATDAKKTGCSGKLFGCSGKIVPGQSRVCAAGDELIQNGTKEAKFMKNIPGTP